MITALFQTCFFSAECVNVALHDSADLGRRVESGHCPSQFSKHSAKTPEKVSEFLFRHPRPHGSLPFPYALGLLQNPSRTTVSEAWARL